MSGRILIIEDEEKIARFVELELNHEGYETEKCTDGRSGLDAALVGNFDCILLDIMLPGLSGIEIISRARKENISVPIILLTAKSQVEDKIEGLNIGADDYITKPFDGGELIARIGARLRKQTDPTEGKVRAYDIVLNPSTYRLEKDGKSVKLSKTEYQLLEYFMINKGQIISKDMIINKVWGNEDNTEYNNIEVYVSFLRKKLKFVNAVALISTKKGIGYSLTDGEI